MSDNGLGRGPSSRRGFTIVELLAVIAVIAMLLALLLPFRRSAGPAARRSQCTNNLKQIALALLNYENTYKALPPAYTVDAAGRPLHSWRTLILPNMDQQALYDTIDLTKPWNDPANAQALATVVAAYRCPDAPAGKPTATSYLAIVSPTAAFLPDAPRPLADITDGRDSTIAVIEADAASAVPWMAPQDADEAIVLTLSSSKTLHHAVGTHAALVDGSVRFLKSSFASTTIRALMTVAGGEMLSADGY